MLGVHRTCAETATVSHGTSHITTKQHCNHSGGIFRMCCVKLVTRSQLHMTKAQWVSSEAGNRAMVAVVKCLGLIWR